MRLSIIIPTLNEASAISTVLSRLQVMRATGVEIIVVDGGSSDATAQLAKPFADRVTISKKGRATQMNVGAAIARGDVLLFLHADTTLPDDAQQLILRSLAENKKDWGRFDVAISNANAGAHFMFPVIAWMMNHRSRLTGIATGDQAIFTTRTAFDRVGGFPDQRLMEDVEICTRLKKFGAPICLREHVVTSGRRWEKYGVWRTIVLMWRLRLQYFFGATPDSLHKIYDKN